MNAIRSLFLVLLLAATAAANTVTFDAEPLGSLYGPAAGHAPGDFLFTEDSADNFIDLFWLSGSPYFNQARIEAPLLGFGSGHVLNLNNISLATDFTAPGVVTFRYLLLGGEVTLQFDGLAAPLQAQDFVGMTGTYAGVGVSATATPVPGGMTGTVTLTGAVQHLWVGGQELWIDDLFCDNGIGPVPVDCDYEVIYDPQPLGMTWGGAFGNTPGDLAFVEDGIPVLIDTFDAGTGPLFNFMRIEAAFPPIGDVQLMNVNNVTQHFAINALGIVVERVTFEYLDQGGTENLQVNGAPLHIGDLHLAPALIAPGVTCNVSVTPTGLGLLGEVTLIGDVQELVVGGQEFFMDNLCVTEAGEVDPCDLEITHEYLGVGTQWGGAFGQSPGDFIFAEDGIPVLVERFDTGSFVFFNECQVMASLLGLGSGNIQWMNNISNYYDIAAVAVGVQSVTFDYLDMGGVENLQVNGAPLYVGDLHLAPANIAPGVTFSVTTLPVGGGLLGTVTLVGPVDKLLVGGQEFAVDDFCIESAAVVGVDPVKPVRTAVRMEPNFPNPFNPSTTLHFALERGGRVRLTVHDMKGRLVRTLVDGERPAGPHAEVWDGRDAHGAAAGTGIYFARIESRDGVDTRKIALIK